MKNNRKRTRGRNFYYQRVNRKEPIYERRIVGIRNKWYHRILLFLKLMRKSRIAIRKNIVIDYKSIPTNKVIKHVVRSSAEIRLQKALAN
jgi:hypothetical protein